MRHRVNTRKFGRTSAHRMSMFRNMVSSLIKHEIFLWCRDRGVKAVVLGGGYRPDDGILRFKRQFGRDIDVPYLLGLKTYDAEESNRLVEARRQWERGQGRDWNPVPSYFPEYRS